MGFLLTLNKKKNFAFSLSNLYRNNLKDREFGKEAAQIFESGASDHCRERLRTLENSPGDCFQEKQVNAVNWPEGGTSEDQKFAAKLTQPKTDSSGYFGISLNYNETT